MLVELLAKEGGSGRSATSGRWPGCARCAPGRCSHRDPGFIRRNWKLKVGCCLIAFVTWSASLTWGNSPETKVVSLPVPQSPASIPARYYLARPVSNAPGSASAVIRTHWIHSTRRAPTVNVDWPAVNRAGTYLIPMSITSSGPIEPLPPTSVQVDLDVLISNSVQIQITSPPPVGFQSGQLATPSTVVVDGPQHQLAVVVRDRIP